MLMKQSVVDDILHLRQHCPMQFCMQDVEPFDLGRSFPSSKIQNQESACISTSEIV